HGDVILLTAGGGDIVGAGGVGQHLGFVEQGDGGHVGNHESAGDAGVRGEEGGQAVVQIGGDQAVDATLGHRGQGGERGGSGGEGECERGAMKISAGEHIAGIGKHERIVGGGPGFDFHGGARERQGVAHGAVYLRHAAQAVGVLDAGGRGAAGGIDIAWGQGGGQMGGGGGVVGGAGGR